MKAAVSLLLPIVIHTLVDGYQHFQLKIPNGEIIPHPCKPNFLWRGVGHDNLNGGGPRNAFGSDFENNGQIWNSTVCLMDSDGDGKTNGKELGDPDCVWKPKDKPSFITGLSHPGVCEPMDSPECEGKNSFMNCELNEFKCPALETENSKEVSIFNARLTNSGVPRNRETTYVCQAFEFPHKEQHIIAFKPIVINQQMVHHITVFGCRGTFSGDTRWRLCGMVPSPLCLDMIAVWSLGMSGHCMHKDCGIPVGGTKGYKWAALQIHWNNPQHLHKQFDSSGIVFYLSSKLRSFNAGILSIGQTELAIPAGREEYTEWGTCDAQCTKLIIHDDITVVSVYNHMHYLGKAQTTDLIRRTGTTESIQHLAEDKLYSYDDPKLHEFEDGIIVKAGDELKTTCVYKSTSRHNVTYFGDDTDDEMCFSFLTYFPAENSETACLSRGKGSLCRQTDAEVCDLARFDMSGPEMLTMLNDIQRLCTPGLCRNECLVFVREWRKDPCYEEVNGNLRKQLVRVKDFDYYINTLFAAFDSCNMQLLMEELSIQLREEGCKLAGDGWQTLNHASKSTGLSVYLWLSLIFLLIRF
ncbi:uncharacterized protein LOC123546565 isoform X2 [Mercenaria mercenaria]|uniref:uncharacterized protein LOC123546565 isoform X2 n=1 Tax=Mercenaria mercenaria TaxID=6596 RepID=UPI00234EE712|nr:uncharacterized protein LOC123546565 isoform X2 [Mercenaria mercenaria]